MKKIVFYTAVFLFVHISLSATVSSKDSVNVSPFGKVFIYRHSATPANVIIMISGDAGWKYGVVDFAETFSESNSLVIGVDILRYFKDLRQRTGDCYNVASDFVNLAAVIEKRYNFSDYRSPVIMGYSSGATLVYGILAQARPGTFIGGISLGFCPDIDLPKKLCQTNGLVEKADPTGNSYFLEPDASLGNSWIILQGKLDRICNYSEVADFVKKTSDAELISIPDEGHGFSKWSNFMPQWKDAYTRLIGKYDSSQTTTYSKNDLKGLPLEITHSKIRKIESPVALIISGDGGWYSFEQLIADKLAEHGIPTIGLDSRKYFWNRRTPEETAADIAKALSYYCKLWGKERLLLIGYSLGAEIVPFIVNRLPRDMKEKINLSVLLSPETNTDFEIHISNMLGLGNNKNTYLVMDEILKMKDYPTLCIFGKDEKSKIPELLKDTFVKISIIPGDHHYKFNVPLIVQTMIDKKAF
jgi:type IV secretory pathway VirJ component